MNVDKDIAQQLCRLCMWTYHEVLHPGESEDDRTRGLDFRGTAFDPTVVSDARKVANAVVFEHPECVAVAFQGTITEFTDDNLRKRSIIDWLNNVEVEQLPTERSGLPGLVHKGFFEEAAPLMEDIEQHLSEFRAAPENRHRKLFVTGHSQGGAAAAIATKLLELHGFPVDATFTFAAARPGNQEFAASISAPVFRFEFGDDIVPHLPPTLAFLTTLDHDDLVQIVLDAADNSRELPNGISILINAAAVVIRLGFGTAGGKIKSAIRTILENFERHLGDRQFVGAGRLIYQSSARELSHGPGNDEQLFLDRVKRLIRARSNWVEHHHLKPNYLSDDLESPGLLQSLPDIAREPS